MISEMLEIVVNTEQEPEPEQGQDVSEPKIEPRDEWAVFNC